MAISLKYLVCYQFVAFLQVCSVSAEYGFIQIKRTSTKPVEICAAYNSEFQPFPVGIPEAPWQYWHQTVTLYPDMGCTNALGDYDGKIVIVSRGNCTFFEKALNVQNANGIGILIVSSDGLLIPGASANESDVINISVAVITENSYKQYADMQFHYGPENLRIYEYAPVVKSSIDPNAVIMWLLAVFTCAAGAWFQGKSTQKSKLVSSSNSNNAQTESNEFMQDDEQVDLHITIKHAFIFFCMCSVSILLMYFFFDYLVYFIIGVFCYASALSLFDLFYSAFKQSACFVRHRIPSNNIPCFKKRPPILGILLFVACATFSITWAVYRKAWFAWIMQDILGVGFCIYMIKSIKLPSFKVCTILLVLFFVYDVFYVFITPFFTKDRESIMVHVATGGTGKTKEELPMLFKLPKFELLSLSKCTELPYSMLGYGDVILPGLHVGFCAVWDAKTSESNTVTRHSYYLSAIAGYGVGLVITFIAMIIMMTGQPALLYLVPCCLISTLLVALKRKELHEIWNAKLEKTSNTDGETQPEENHGLLDNNVNL